MRADPAALSLEGVLVEIFGRVLDDKLAPVRAALDELKRAAPPAYADVEQVAAITGLSPATIRRRVADGTYRRAPGARGTRVLVELSSLRGADDLEIARLARAAREGQ
jgi:hypothetical protein